jgi:hypothetical protein
MMSHWGLGAWCEVEAVAAAEYEGDGTAYSNMRGSLNITAGSILPMLEKTTVSFWLGVKGLLGVMFRRSRDGKEVGRGS